ncbi:6176_t:CDS:2 [Gigaspora margarita]|uniref:6176_t:CDS:1 n=1 Tax=Gigaspora margarita TaxID=4874 RepID=A0ABN7UP05_GIGMA|nr:6176_t:CDS:2 [Gigaspora margarita]
MRRSHPEYIEQIKTADEIKENNLASNIKLSLDYKLHPGAIYTSRFLKISNLPLPINTTDYEQELTRLLEDSDIMNLEIPEDH